MNQNEQGTLFPFRLSGSKMRQAAVRMRRQGQALDAVTLVRRAAEQDQTPAAWQALADELRWTGNPEAAARILSRILAMDPHQPGVWIDLAHCFQTMGHAAKASDCAYHQLQEDPWSADGDAARALLAEIEPPSAGHSIPHRTEQMIRRGLFALPMGNPELGHRRIRRALRLTDDKPKLLVSAAMFSSLTDDRSSALAYLLQVRRYDPQNALALTALAALLKQMDRPRAARFVLDAAIPFTKNAMEEDRFLATARALNARTQLTKYLDVHLRVTPHRIPLLIAKAALLRKDDPQAANPVWQEILAIDPDNRTAASYLSCPQADTGHFAPLAIPVPQEERIRQQEEFTALAAQQSVDETLCIGSRSRQLLDWMFASDSLAEQHFAADAVSRMPASPAVTQLLKELLAAPALHGLDLQWALVRLGEAGYEEDLLLHTPDGYKRIQCRRLNESQQRQPWLIFLPALLSATRQYRQSSQIAAFAAVCWKHMTPSQRLSAASDDRYAWCTAIEVLYLRRQGLDKKAMRAATRGPLPPRRISRVLRALQRRLTGYEYEFVPASPEKGDIG